MKELHMLVQYILMNTAFSFKNVLDTPTHTHTQIILQSSDVIPKGERMAIFDTVEDLIPCERETVYWHVE